MNNNLENIKLLLENSANGVTITLGDSSRMLDSKTIKSVVEHFEQWLDWHAHWIHEANCYKDYSIEKIDSELHEEAERSKMYDDYPIEYSVGFDFASYLGISTELGFCNNTEASEIVKADWKKQFPYWEKDLEFDPESNFCYVYTKRRNVARAFRWWSYNKYIKHHLEDFKV
jgi:hypothetical protein